MSAAGVRVLAAGQHRRMRWKNGLGWTHEVAREPAGERAAGGHECGAEEGGDGRAEDFAAKEMDCVGGAEFAPGFDEIGKALPEGEDEQREAEQSEIERGVILHAAGVVGA